MEKNVVIEDGKGYNLDVYYLKFLQHKINVINKRITYTRTLMKKTNHKELSQVLDLLEEYKKSFEIHLKLD